MLYATAPVIHRKGVSAAGVMAAATGNATDKTGIVATANITVTANTAAIAAMVLITVTTNTAVIAAMVIITDMTDNMNMVATAITMSTMSTMKATVVTKRVNTVVTKRVNTVVTAVAEKGFAVCLIMVTCVL